MLTAYEQTREVIRLRDEENKTFSEIAEELGVSDRTVRRRYQAEVLHRTAEAVEDPNLEAFPDTDPVLIKANQDYLPEYVEEIERFKPLVVKGNAMLTCDLHIPLYDPGLVNVMIRVAKEQGIKQLIIDGDFWNMDDYSSYPPVQPEAKFSIERKEGNLVMKTLLRHFDHIFFGWGNHDFRLTRSLGYKYSFTECMRWTFGGLTEDEFSKIHFTDLDYMYYQPGGPLNHNIRVCHPNNYSDIPLTIGRKLAVKYGCSVYTAHSHHCAIGVAQNGKDLVIEGGGFFNKARTEYIQRTNPNHEWVQGFFYFKEGIPYMISPVIGTDLPYRKEVNYVK